MLSTNLKTEVNLGDPRLPKRFWDKVHVVAEASKYVSTPCWIWGASVSGPGYARFGMAGRPDSGHRTAYEFLVETIAPGLWVDHLCRNRPCVNPAHLEPVTPKENLRRYMLQDGVKYGATHCLRGHPYNEENTRRDKLGRRYCRACDRRSHNMAYAARKARETLQDMEGGDYSAFN